MSMGEIRSRFVPSHRLSVIVDCLLNVLDAQWAGLYGQPIAFVAVYS